MRGWSIAVQSQVFGLQSPVFGLRSSVRSPSVVVSGPPSNLLPPPVHLFGATAEFQDGHEPTIDGEKQQRYYGAFQRSFALPRTVDVEHVKAVFEKGVLRITLPKLPQSKGRQIAVTKG